MAAKGDSMINRFAIWHSTELKVLGGVEVAIALMLILPALYALFVGEDTSIFIDSMMPVLILGVVQFFLFAPSVNFRTVNGLILVALCWLVMFVLGSLPYLYAGMEPVNAVFESVNGFTTTGSSIIEDVNEWPVSLMIWRSMTQWLGGIAVVVIFIYILPMFGMGRTFFSNELEGSGSSQFSMKLKNAAGSFIIVYLALTILNFLMLLLCQASFVDALCMGLTTISTGGLIVSNNSLSDMNISIQIVTMLFMFIGGVNFYLHFKAIIGRRPGEYLHNKELRYLLLWFLAASLVIFVLYTIPKIQSAGFDFNTALMDFKNILFTVISLGTTTGLYVTDFADFSEIILLILLVVMIIGASAGSTSGGIKFGRIRIITRFFNNTFKQILHPNAVYTVNVDDESIDDSRVLSAVSITLLYILTMFLGTIVLLSQGLNWFDSIGLAAATVTNTGMGFGSFGPTGSFIQLNDGTKIFLMLLMWVGRLEISLALVFFTRTFWRDVRLAYRSSVKGRKL